MPTTRTSIAHLHVQALKASLHEAREALQEGLLNPVLSDPELRRELLELGDDAHDLAAALHAALASNRAVPTRPLEPPQDGGIRVVAVDDDVVALRALNELLAPEFEVLTTTDPHEAIRLARDGVEAALIDLHMPVMDGLGLLHVLQGDPRTAAIPCLLVSANSDTREKLRAFEAGACDYLTKPVAIDELAARLRNAIARGRELRRERHLQETDELTGLTNRRGFRGFLVDALRRANNRSRTVALAMIDQDNLKPINDSWGHAAGDAALRIVARTLSLVKRDGDCAARLGGDEFALVMPGADLEGARKLIDRVERVLSDNPLILPDGTRLVLHVSCGAAASRAGDDLNGEALLERADGALYEVKRIRTEAGLAGRTPSGAFPAYRPQG